MAKTPNTDELRQQVTEAGFDVGLAVEGYSEGGTVYPAMYRVSGHGLDVSLDATAVEAWEELLVHADAATAVVPGPEPGSPPEPGPAPEQGA